MRPTILFAQSTLRPPGGNDAVAAWLIEALRDDYQLTFAARERPDLAAVNRYYGTTLRDGDIGLLSANTRFGESAKFLEGPPVRFHRARYLRWCRRVASAFDLVVSPLGEIDIGHRTIQYVNFPHGRSAQLADARRSGGPWNAANRIYAAATSRLGEETAAGIRRNLTLANTEWMARIFRELYGPDARIEVLHPPVDIAFPATPWPLRRDGFVSIGRLHEDKRIVEMIGIVEQLRAAGHDLTFDIIGSIVQRNYYERVRSLAAERPWVTISLDVPRAALPALVASFRYGLHGMAEEHFGMAIAEMAAAGCVVFTPRGGGQVEIVDSDERLLYGSPEEACRKIAHILADAALQHELSATLRARVRRFSRESFIRRVREIAAREIGANPR